jgi:hypothetical protein
MNPFWSRIVVGAALLPIVLWLVWLGGWWLFALALAGGILALHELYVIARGLRPLVLGGYAGLVLVLLGAELGGPPWLVAGIGGTFVLSFLVFGISDARPSFTGAMGTTMLGVVWVAGGLAALCWFATRSAAAWCSSPCSSPSGRTTLLRTSSDA